MSDCRHAIVTTTLGLAFFALSGTGLLMESASTAYAARGSSSSSSMIAPYGPMLDLGAMAGYGSSNNDSNSVPSRAVHDLTAFVDFGYKFKFVAPLLFFQYGVLAQPSGVSNANNQNLSGSAYTIGSGLQFRYRRYFLTAIYNFLGEYTLQKKTTGDASASYSKPTGYTVLVGLNFGPYYSAFINYQSISYSEWSLDSSSRSISSDQLTHASYGVGLAYSMY